MLNFSKKLGSRLTALAVILSFSLAAFPLKAQPKPASPPKCEKCYRGADGKIKCDPIPCPK